MLASAGLRPLRHAAFWAALAGATVADWLDGPLARRAGTASEAGARFDLEADSALTAACAVAAWRRGCGAWVLVAPLARYAAPGRFVARRGWQRAAGAAQMVALLAVISPWRPVRAAGAALGPAAAVAQVVSLAADAAVQRRPKIGEAVA